MGWDTAGRRKLLLEAATGHFAEHGLAGARVDAIAAAAGVNKQRIYQYFGDKDALFAEVMRQAMENTIGAAELSGSGPEALVRYAARLFDTYAAHPDLARLLAWEALERRAPIAFDDRVAAWTQKTAALRAALPHLDDESARHLLLSTFTLVTGWWSLRQLQAVLLPGACGDHPRREELLDQIRRLAQPEHGEV
ncbi:TetR family transcriptional regulator [Nocardia yamanashiensis]|uniref:TetR/AcrR family transcriptional regulator n=1 Tax=Nocardia yamanashiensis TaxID=209247 RepID=UPI001E601975|nr:TetR family transcriptional regulator [Nocardia yamanashiensis]UGT43508.1 TetR family transcriptional regulator [Nocardia yamanashiensis]